MIRVEVIVLEFILVSVKLASLEHIFEGKKDIICMQGSNNAASLRHQNVLQERPNYITAWYL